MSASAKPLSNIATSSSLPIGVLTINPHDPFQDLYDSFPTKTALPAEIIVKPFGIYRTNSTNKKISELRSNLADILALTRRSTKMSSSRLSTPESERHYLSNHKTWFEAQCRNEDTRSWAFKNWNYGNDIYLIVGLLVLADPKLVIESAMRQERGQQGGIPVPAGFATVCSAVSSIDGIISTPGTRDVVKSSFEAPGKSIFGVWYRKIKVGWLRSRDLYNSRLAASTTWNPLWQWRGGEKAAEADEEEDVEEDDDEEDLIYLELQQESEWGSEDDEKEGQICMAVDTHEPAHVRESSATNLSHSNSITPSLKQKFSQGDVGEVSK
ncbi:hypothetical protein DFP73DRAFT_599709 [Morchella snyderi]|nr:hypothetical protein DFP73DRAFT_599709 [Morchella snyderi]